MLLYYLLRAGRNKKIKLKFKFLLHEKESLFGRHCLA